MNTLPWDTNDNISAGYSLLLWCVIASIFLHLAFLVYFDIPKKIKEKKEEHAITSITIDLRAMAKTVKKPTEEKSIKKTAKKTKKEVINKKNIVSKNSKAKPIHKKYSALEKTTPIPTKKQNIEKNQKEETTKKHIEAIGSKKTIQPQEQVDAARRVNEKNRMEYKALLENWLSRYKKYPIASRKKRQEDTVVVSFTIDAEGKLLSHNINQASKYRLLNKAVIKMLKKANPMPAVPKDIRGKNTRFNYTIPIKFSLDRL